jgi:hypothetical protein
MSSAILAWEFCIVAAISSRRQIGITNQPVRGAPALPPTRLDE